MANVYDGVIKRVEHFRVTNDKGEFEVKRIETYRPSHITACDVADTSVQYEIVHKLDPVTYQKVMKQIQDARKGLKTKEYPKWTKEEK